MIFKYNNLTAGKLEFLKFVGLTSSEFKFLGLLVSHWVLSSPSDVEFWVLSSPSDTEFMSVPGLVLSVFGVLAAHSQGYYETPPAPCPNGGRRHPGSGECRWFHVPLA